MAGPGSLHGWSAGASLGLLALAALLDEAVPPFFATGGVLDGHGTWGGGAATLQKATAARDFASQLGLSGCRFFSPPLRDAPTWPDLPIVMATDLGSAYARLDPRGYAKVRARHRDLRRVDVRPGEPSLDAARPFAIVSGPEAQRLPSRVGGIQVVPRTQERAGPAWVELGTGGLVLWRVEWPRPETLEENLPALFALAQGSSVA